MGFSSISIWVPPFSIFGFWLQKKHKNEKQPHHIRCVQIEDNVPNRMFSNLLYEFEFRVETDEKNMKKDGRLSESDALLLPEFTLCEDDCIAGSMRGCLVRRETQDETKVVEAEHSFVCILRTSCCAICINDFQIEDVITCLLPCNHAFHKVCVTNWLMNYNGSCPLCMEKVDPNERKNEKNYKSQSKKSNSQSIYSD